MGKYMRKAKITADVAVMEVSQSTLGVRTRAKTLALQRLQSSSSATPPSPSSNFPDSSCYLQLRSRRLEKPSLLRPQPHRQLISPPKDASPTQSQPRPGSTSNSRLRVTNSAHSGSLGSDPVTRTKNLQEGCFFVSTVAEQVGLDFDLGVEASFGENNLDFEPRESRSTRESTPCSLIRGVDVATPGSSTRQKTANAVNRRGAILDNVPSASEIEEFFASADQCQRRQFIEKYNFDVVNDFPLPGRYEWVKVSR
nr:cyclin-dependent kinase inhibitor 3-like isoform X1 [Coffea arabica]